MNNDARTMPPGIRTASRTGLLAIAAMAALAGDGATQPSSSFTLNTALASDIPRDRTEVYAYVDSITSAEPDPVPMLLIDALEWTDVTRAILFDGFDRWDLTVTGAELLDLLLASEDRGQRIGLARLYQDSAYFGVRERVIADSPDLGFDHHQIDRIVGAIEELQDAFWVDELLAPFPWALEDARLVDRITRLQETDIPEVYHRQIQLVLARGGVAWAQHAVLDHYTIERRRPPVLRNVAELDVARRYTELMLTTAISGSVGRGQLWSIFADELPPETEAFFERVVTDDLTYTGKGIPWSSWQTSPTARIDRLASRVWNDPAQPLFERGRVLGYWARMHPETRRWEISPRAAWSPWINDVLRAHDPLEVDHALRTIFPAELEPDVEARLQDRLSAMPEDPTEDADARTLAVMAALGMSEPSARLETLVRRELSHGREPATPLASRVVFLLDQGADVTPEELDPSELRAILDEAIGPLCEDLATWIEAEHARQALQGRPPDDWLAAFVPPAAWSSLLGGADFCGGLLPVESEVVLRGRIEAQPALSCRPATVGRIRRWRDLFLFRLDHLVVRGPLGQPTAVKSWPFALRFVGWREGSRWRVQSFASVLRPIGAVR